MFRIPLRRALVALAFAGIALDVPAGPVNVNTADAATLARELKGVGLKRAQAIVEHRTRNGPFRSADELALVKGVGRGAVEKNRADLRFDAAKPVTKPQAASPAQSPAAPARRP